MAPSDRVLVFLLLVVKVDSLEVIKVDIVDITFKFKLLLLIMMILIIHLL